MKKIIKFLLLLCPLGGCAVWAELPGEMELNNYAHGLHIQSNGASSFDHNNETEQCTWFAERKKTEEYLHATSHVEKTPLQCPYLYNSTAINELFREWQSRNPLYEAIKNNKGLAINSMVRPGSDIHYAWTKNFLHEAIKNDDVCAMNELLGDGAGIINVQDEHGNSLLHGVAAYGGEKIAALLLARGARINAHNQQGLIPLDYAFKNSRVAHLFVTHVAGTRKNDESYEQFYEKLYRQSYNRIWQAQSSHAWSLTGGAQQASAQEIDELMPGVVAQLRNY